MKVVKDKFNSVIEYSVDESLSSRKIAVHPSNSKHPFPITIVIGRSTSMVALDKQGVKELIRALTECL